MKTREDRHPSLVDLASQAAKVYGMAVRPMDVLNLEHGLRTGTLPNVAIDPTVFAVEWCGRWVAVAIHPTTRTVHTFMTPAVLVNHRQRIEAGMAGWKAQPVRPASQPPPRKPHRGKPRKPAPKVDPAVVLAGLPDEPELPGPDADESAHVAATAQITARLMAVRERIMADGTTRPARRVLEREMVRLAHRRRTEFRQARRSVHKRVRAEAAVANPADPIEVLLAWYRAAGRAIEAGAFAAAEYDARAAAEWCLRHHGRIA